VNIEVLRLTLNRPLWAALSCASLLQRHQNAVERLAVVPGLGVDSAQQIIAEVGAKAATFPSA
jgi:hypothetical protein